MLAELPPRAFTILVVGDSTGDSSSEWVRLFCDEIATWYPSRRVIIRQWSNVSSSWTWGYIRAAGTPTIHIYNGSFSGANPDTSRQATGIYTGLGNDLNPSEDHTPDVVLISHGHNASENAVTFRTQMKDLIAAIRNEAPDCEIGLISQNRRSDNNSQEVRRFELQRLAQNNGYVFLDVHNTLDQLGSPTVFTSDGIHPNAIGTTTWYKYIAQQLLFS